ncbi:hypothetical protein [Candidatus Berkiella aquae]|uniref:Uncharacterized protein n=1 Tax=Candidatus Berkiella aquae TaxID=295108 RepID=A0A0Q9YLJ9_9GAMM|nr:hypothetical protein [Candidatus Berkiella aquae]MCS5711571.1 hypothetical protein [Candidatus Berkiella aquae]
MKDFRILLCAFVMMWFMPVEASPLNSNPSSNPGTPTPHPTTPPAHMPTVMPKPAPAAIAKDIFKLSAVVTGCEMNDQCIVTMLNELIKTDPNPAYKDYLKRVEAQKPLVENNIKMCNTQSIGTFKKAISLCIADSMTTLEKAPGNLVELNTKVEKQVKECLSTNMHTLATAGNVYAQMTMAQDALETNDTKTYQYWYAMVREQARTTAEINTVQNCAEGLDFSLKILGESIRMFAGLPNK